MKSYSITFAVACVCLSASAISADAPDFREAFDVNKGDLSPTGKSEYFILEPGFTAVYEGKEDGEEMVLTITVTDKTKTVDGVETRVVEEKETANGKVVEISQNYFAISKATGDAYYFGEDSVTYKDGKEVNHEGSWLAGVAGARFGLALPGKPKVGVRIIRRSRPRWRWIARRS